MFQLEHELQEWTKRFGRIEAMRSSDIEELEQHVRDSIAALTSKGLNEEEAFMIAAHRVGRPGPIGREFGKVNGGHAWGHRVFWMLAGYLFFEVCRLSIAAVAWLGQVVAILAGGDGTAMGYASVGVTAICWIGLAIWMLRWSAKRNDGQWDGKIFAQSRGRVIGGLVVIVLVGLLMKIGSQATVIQLTHVSDYGQAAMITFYANSLFALLIPLAFLFVMISIRRTMRDMVVAEH